MLDFAPIEKNAESNWNSSKVLTKKLKEVDVADWCFWEHIVVIGWRRGTEGWVFANE